MIRILEDKELVEIQLLYKPNLVHSPKTSRYSIHRMTVEQNSQTYDTEKAANFLLWSSFTVTTNLWIDTATSNRPRAIRYALTVNHFTSTYET